MGGYIFAYFDPKSLNRRQISLPKLLVLDHILLGTFGLILQVPINSPCVLAMTLILFLNYYTLVLQCL